MKIKYEVEVSQSRSLAVTGQAHITDELETEITTFNLLTQPTLRPYFSACNRRPLIIAVHTRPDVQIAQFSAQR